MIRLSIIDYRRIFRMLYTNVIRRSILFFMIGGIILALTEHRFMFQLYFFIYLLSFGVSFVMWYRKPDRHSELTEGDI